MSIRAKVVLAITLVFVLGAAAVSLFLKADYESGVKASALESVRQDKAVFAQLEADDTAKLSATALALEQNAAYRDAFVRGDREGLFAITKPVFDELKSAFKITHWYFETTAGKGQIFLRVHKPEQFGDTLKRKTYLKAIETGKPATGLELGATAVALRVVRPYYAADGTTVAGYMELGQEIDGFLGSIKQQTGDEIGLLLAKGSMDSSAWAAMRENAGEQDNWDAQADYVVAGATDPSLAAAMTYDEPIDALADEGEVFGTTVVSGRSVVRGAFPIKDAAGERIGLMFISHDITDDAAALRSSTLSVLGAVLAMLALVLLVVVLLMNALVFGRLDGMIRHMEDISLRMAGGDFNAVYETKASSDELGRFESFFAKFIASTAATLRQLAGEGDKK